MRELHGQLTHFPILFFIADILKIVYICRKFNYPLKETTKFRMG